jgi:hypothetical protein
MLHRAPFRLAFCACAALALVLVAALGVFAQVSRPLSKEEIRALMGRTIANQHRNDEALAEFERIERRQIRKDESDTALSEDKMFRVVPTGTGTIRLTLEEDGQPVSADLRRRQLSELEGALVRALDPAESRQKRAVDKFDKRIRERTEMIGAIGDAFLFTWQGRETSGGRSLVRLLLEPNPEFKPHSRSTEYFHHTRAVVWIDEAAAQLVRAEAEVATDIAIGGGILGKIYHGGRVIIEQSRVAEGVWLPVRYDYNLAGRKFVFGFELHEVTLASSYRRIGPPKEALAAIRRELNNPSAAPASH